MTMKSVEGLSWMKNAKRSSGKKWRIKMIESCKKGKKVREWETGDTECNAYSVEYECGGIYHHNYMDIVGCRDHDCFWDCSGCKHDCLKEVRDGQ